VQKVQGVSERLRKRTVLSTITRYREHDNTMRMEHLPPAGGVALGWVASVGRSLLGVVVLDGGTLSRGLVTAVHASILELDGGEASPLVAGAGRGFLVAWLLTKSSSSTSRSMKLASCFLLAVFLSSILKVVGSLRAC